MFAVTSRLAVVETLEKRTHLSVATFGNGTTSGGSYTFVDFMEEDPNYFVSSRGNIALNTTGGLAGAVTETSSTDGQATTESFSGTYSLANDGFFREGSEVGGYVPATGDLAVLSPVYASDSYTALTMAVRRGTNMSNASANGRYNMGMWFGNGLRFMNGKGYVDLLGNGNVNYNITNVWQGQATASDRLGVGSGTDTYSVSSNGSMSVSDSWVGALRPDGQMFVFGDGGNSSVGDVGIAVGVKQGSGMTAASIKGRYQGIVMASGVVGGVKYWSSGAAWFDFNGTSGLTGSIWQVQHGQASGGWLDPGTFTGGYTLSATGGLAMNVDGVLSGFVSADGSVIVVPVVGDTAYKENGLLVLVRAPIAGKTGGVLQVNGTSLNDVLTVTPNSTNLVVSTGYRTQNFATSGITQITADSAAGNDRITLNANIASLLKGGVGNDTIIGYGASDTLYGNDGNDVLYGNSGNDEILAGLGNDSIDAGGGADDVYGGDGTDTIRGGVGDDYIEGKGKSDTIFGDDGNDTIYGGAGSDYIYGNAGNDYIDVQKTSLFHDTVEAGIGFDTVLADGDDVVSGADVLL